MYRKRDTQPGCIDILCFLIAMIGAVALLVWIMYAYILQAMPW